MKCSIIGCGRNVEEMHMPAIEYIDDLKVISICDINEERVIKFRKEYGISQCYNGLNDFFQNSDDADFIIISTPGFTHYDICKQALEHDINILVEKPFVLTHSDAMSLKKIAEDKDLNVGVIQNYRYRDPVIHAKRAQEKGVVGNIKQFNAVFHGQAIFNEPTSWSWEERKNKVLLYEMMIHLLDLEIYFAGPVKKILSCHKKVDQILDTTTNIYALVEHENGAIGMIDFQLFSSSNYIGFEIFGTANDIKIKLQPHYYRIYSGTVNPIDELYYDFKRIWDFGIEILKDKFNISNIDRRAKSHHALIQEYVNSIKNKKPFSVGLDEIMPTMLYAQMLSDLIYD